MACYNPVKGFRTPNGVVFSALRRYDILGSIELPCGQCIGCRLRRAREWAVRCVHEAQMWESASFVTLTYSPENLPAGGSLVYRDFQLFMKRLRKRMSGAEVRFFMCGEYGPETLRPHYHAILFGAGFSDRKYHAKSASGQKMFTSKLLGDSWQLGNCTVQDVTMQTAAYCARYVVDKITGDLAPAHYGERVPEFCHCSVRPGIGRRWYEKYGTRVANQDFCIVDGRKEPLPRYYDKLSKKNLSVDVDSVAFERYKRGVAAVGDSSPDRLAVREEVSRARARFLKRSAV